MAKKSAKQEVDNQEIRGVVDNAYQANIDSSNAASKDKASKSVLCENALEHHKNGFKSVLLIGDKVDATITIKQTPIIDFKNPQWAELEKAAEADGNIAEILGRKEVTKVPINKIEALKKILEDAGEKVEDFMTTEVKFAPDIDLVREFQKKENNKTASLASEVISFEKTASRVTYSKMKS